MKVKRNLTHWFRITESRTNNKTRRTGKLLASKMMELPVAMLHETKMVRIHHNECI